MSKRSIRMLLAALVVAAFAVGASSAHAGEWMQISCTNPSGTSSNGQGWTEMQTTALGPNSNFSTNCTNQSPLDANLGGPVGESQTMALTYTPPAGSTMVGGSINGILTAPGGGDGASNVAEIFAPAYSYPGDLLPNGNCVECGVINGPWTLPDANGTITLSAGCSYEASGTGSCNAAANGYAAQVSVSAADILLQNGSTPSASGFTGTLLGSSVSGTGTLNFTATDSGGPGVYNVTVAIDGATVYSATPDTNSGQCVAVGTDKTSGALEFDYSQPCPQTASVSASVPVSSIANGTHELKAIVTDAAGNTATVVDQNITVANPVATTPTTPVTPAPTPPAVLKKIHDKALFSWDYRHKVTRLEEVKLARKAHLPDDARLKVQCEPANLCPKGLPKRSVGVKKEAQLFDALADKHFQPGAMFQLTISAPHRKAERFVWTLRAKRKPIGHERSGEKTLPKHPGSATAKKKPAGKKTKGKKKTEKGKK